MLTINPHSWHYRVYSYWRDQAPNPPATINLCHYMRVLLIYVPLIALLSVFAVSVAAILAAVTAPIWVPCYFLFRNRNWVKRLGQWYDRNSHFLIIGFVASFLLATLVVLTIDTWWYGLIFIGICSLGLAVAVAIALVCFVVSEHRKDKKLRAADGSGGAPSLLWTWVKAKKRRICPILVAETEARS